MANTYGRTQHDYRQRRKSKGYYQKLIIQKLMGLVLLAICGLVVLMAYHGQTVEDRDCTAVVFFRADGILPAFHQRNRDLLNLDFHSA